MQVTNNFSSKQKIYFIKTSKYHLFGTDFEKRECMSDADAIQCFDEVWEKKVREAVLNGDRIEYEEVQNLLTKFQKQHCYKYCEYRKFRLSETVFIAQLEPQVDSCKHNQLWSVTARNYDTRTLYVTFRTNDEKEAWELLAVKFKMDPEELGEKVLKSFLRTFASDENINLAQ